MKYPGYFNASARMIHAWAQRQGFYDEVKDIIELGEGSGSDWVKPMFTAQRIALIHEEVTEVLGAVRDNDIKAEAEEVADVLIRLLDYAAFRNIDVDRAVKEKMEANSERPYRHGRKVF